VEHPPYTTNAAACGAFNAPPSAMTTAGAFNLARAQRLPALLMNSQRYRALCEATLHMNSQRYRALCEAVRSFNLRHDPGIMSILGPDPARHLHASPDPVTRSSAVWRQSVMPDLMSVTRDTTCSSTAPNA